jgi:predicted ABC-type exoprotein transport system permease subunit
MTHEIGSNKVAIITQGVAIVIAFALGAAVLEYSGLLQTSALGRMAAATRLPVVGVAVFLVGLAIAVATAVEVHRVYRRAVSVS